VAAMGVLRGDAAISTIPSVQILRSIPHLVLFIKALAKVEKEIPFPLPSLMRRASGTPERNS
jgi:hypothetical protein